MTTRQDPKQQALRMPPTLVILTIILLLAAILSRILHPGEFEYRDKTIFKAGKEFVVYTPERDGSTELLRDVFGKRLPGDIRVVDVATSDTVALLTAGRPVLVSVYTTENRNVVVPGSYQQLPRPGRTFVDNTIGVISEVVLAPIRGFADKAGIIGFILIIGGAFGVIIATGAIDAALHAAVRVLSGSGAPWLVIPIMMILFSAGGAIFGMSEEVIPFVLITIPLALRLGYDSITGLCMSWLAAGVGFAGAFFNPFTVQIAQGIAEVQPLSGFGLRFVVWLLATGIAIVYTLWWASRVKRNPASSPTFESDKKLAHKFETVDGVRHQLGLRENLVLLALAAGIVLIIWGVIEKGWYMDELSAVFLGVGILAAVVGKLDIHAAANAFVRGASDLVGAALIVAFSAGILIIMKDNSILDTILNSVAGLLEGTHSVIAAWIMFAFQTVLNFFVPSGSGQAAMTMPIMAPLSDLIGVTRQTAVLAFQFGDGFGNLIIPTSAVTMSVLGIAEIPWERWAKWVLPLQIIFFVFGCAVLALAVLTGYS